jgi:phosphoglycolate phosphatase
MRAVLFDLDGTIINSFEGIARSVRYALNKCGIEEDDPDNLRRFIGPPIMDSFQKWYGFSYEQAAEATSYYRERYRPIGLLECELYPGVTECIRALKREGLLIGLASSKPEEFCVRILDNLSILDLFDVVVGSTMDGRIETKEDVLREVLRRWSDVPREEMCLVGDTMFDLEGAKQIGIDCIAVRYGFGDADEMKRNGAIAVCDELSDLPGLIKALEEPTTPQTGNW